MLPLLLSIVGLACAVAASAAAAERPLRERHARMGEHPNAVAARARTAEDEAEAASYRRAYDALRRARSRVELANDAAIGVALLAGAACLAVGAVTGDVLVLVELAAAVALGSVLGQPASSAAQVPDVTGALGGRRSGRGALAAR